MSNENPIADHLEDKERGKAMNYAWDESIRRWR